MKMIEELPETKKEIEVIYDQCIRVENNENIPRKIEFPISIFNKTLPGLVLSYNYINDIKKYTEISLFYYNEENEKDRISFKTSNLLNSKESIENELEFLISTSDRDEIKDALQKSIFNLCDRFSDSNFNQRFKHAMNLLKYGVN